MLILSDEHHTVTSSTVSARERKSSLSKGLCFCEKGSGVRNGAKYGFAPYGSCLCLKIFSVLISIKYFFQPLKTVKTGLYLFIFKGRKKGGC